jgi:hypothetical protein
MTLSFNFELVRIHHRVLYSLHKIEIETGSKIFIEYLGERVKISSVVKIMSFYILYEPFMIIIENDDETLLNETKLLVEKVLVEELKDNRSTPTNIPDSIKEARSLAVLEHQELHHQSQEPNE